MKLKNMLSITIIHNLVQELTVTWQSTCKNMLHLHICPTNVQHSKVCFAWEGTKKATVKIEKQDFTT